MTLESAEDRNAFAEQMQGVLDQLKEGFGVMEKTIPVLQEWMEKRAEYEGKQRVCVCVSDTLEDLIGMLPVLMNVMQTYGNMITQASNRIVDHHEEDIKPVVEAMLKEAVGAIQEKVKNGEKLD